MIGVVADAIDVWWVLLFGALSVGTAAGGGIAMWLEDHRNEGDEAAS